MLPFQTNTFRMVGEWRPVQDAVAWLGDASAVVLIAIRTYRLVFHPEQLVEASAVRANE